MPIELSNRQRKSADRVGGIELMLPWPDELPVPDMDDDSERDATPAERAWVERHVQPACQAAGLVAVRAQVARTAGPSPQGRVMQTRLAVIIIGQRWAGARGDNPPRTMWHEAAMATGRPA